MELFLLYSLVVGFFFTILFLLLRQQPHHHRLPPGTTSWPFIGETLEFLAAGRRGKPQKFVLERMSRFSSSCFKTSLLAENMVVMCGPRGNKFLFSNGNTLVAGWTPSSLRKILFPSSGKDKLKMVRSTFPHFFKPEALQRYVEVMDSVANRHFAEFWEGKHEILVHPLAKKYAFSVGCKLLLSIEDPSHIERITEIFKSVSIGLLSLPIDLPGTRLNKAIKSAELFRKEVKEMIRQRKIDLAEKKATATQDILSLMLTKRIDHDGNREEEISIDEDEIAEKILTLLIGSHDTVSSALTSIVKFLAELPHVYDQVYKEQMDIAKSKGDWELLTWADINKMKYSWNVACEVMRLVPPIQGTFREAIQDFTFSGFQIPKGFKLHWTTSSTHYDPEYFPDPEKFDPSRFEGDGPAPYTFVPFGGGPRMCPGMEYARLDILVFIHNVVKRFRWKKLVGNEKIIFIWVAIPEKGLPVHLVPHKG